MSYGCKVDNGPEKTDRSVLEEEIRQADLALDQTVANRDIEGFRQLIADETAFYGAGGVLSSREAVAEAWAVFFDSDSGTTLTWRPTAVEAAQSGELGFSRGDYTMVAPGEDGQPVESGGDYVTIWRKSSEGQWQAIVDIGNPRGDVE